MKLETVDSSMIHAVGYDAEAQELEVVFNNGQVWRYVEVPPEEFEGLMAADSKGRYMRGNILGCYEEYRVSKKRR
jgi:hypothetical protein